MKQKQFNIQKKFTQEWFDFNPILLFLVLCLLAFLIVYLKKSFLINELAAFEILEERGEMGVFNIFYSLQYFTIPVFYLYKLTLTSFLLWVGCFMFGYKLSFKVLWKLILLLETWFLIPELVKLFWFLGIESQPDYWDIKAFYPLSLMHFFDYQDIQNRWHYILKALNLFEVVYWFMMVYGIYFLSGKKLSYAYAIVFSSYVLFFFIWLLYYLLSYG